LNGTDYRLPLSSQTLANRPRHIQTLYGKTVFGPRHDIVAGDPARAARVKTRPADEMDLTCETP
jgi:hypothetical protein